MSVKINFLSNFKTQHPNTTLTPTLTTRNYEL